MENGGRGKEDRMKGAGEEEEMNDVKNKKKQKNYFYLTNHFFFFCARRNYYYYYFIFGGQGSLHFFKIILLHSNFYERLEAFVVNKSLARKDSIEVRSGVKNHVIV